MNDTALAVQERPLALPSHVVADLLRTRNEVLLAKVESWRPSANPRSKKVFGSSPNPAPIAGWTIEEIAKEYPFPHGEVGDHLWIQEEFQRGFSGHVSHCGYLYRSTDVNRDSNHGLWCYEKNGTFYDHYDRPFPWLPATEMPRQACRLVYEIVSWEIALQYPDREGEIPSNEYFWHITLRRVE
jgi:hypothetical protein